MISEALDDRFDGLCVIEKEMKQFGQSWIDLKNLDKTILQISADNSPNENKFRIEVQKTESIASNCENKIEKVKKIKKTTEKKTIKKKQKKTKDEEYKFKIQNTRRNLFSNVAHHCISFLKKKFVSEQIIAKILNLHDINITLQEFYESMQQIKLKNYVRPEILFGLLKGNYLNHALPKKEQFGKVFRMATFYFLNKECYHSIQLSKKIRYSIKEQHWEKKRELLKQLATCA